MLGMYGSTKSTVDSASEHAIDKLHWKFVEYSRLYKRQKAIGVYILYTDVLPILCAANTACYTHSIFEIL